ncbi:outer membrane protein with beta-barrel domain [Tamilnaduibacter salinus]|nr:outer membrane beta-barrel protein [Tamilnaduibacter salinus]PVY78394.1 outer membrane protein with beta-barrel domain [Tamilnaduibacter salinus]
MNNPRSTARLLAALLIALPMAVSAQSARQKAPQAPEPEDRTDRTYVGVYGTALEFRTLGADGVSEWGDAATVVLGSHLSEYVHVELRYTKGLGDTKVSEAFTIDFNRAASWYMGLHYPITYYANVYAQAGFSHMDGESRLTPADEDTTTPFDEFPEEYPEQSFAVSWIAGIDLEIIDNGYFVLEAGRLFEDTESRSHAFQFHSGLRYEF